MTALRLSLVSATIFLSGCSTDATSPLADREWSSSTPMPYPVSDHSATATPNGDAVYIVGGCVEDQVRKVDNFCFRMLWWCFIHVAGTVCAVVCCMASKVLQFRF